MNNLINNAVKYNKQKGNLNIHSYLVDQDYIIEVSDTGRGISLIDQGRVFERFFMQGVIRKQVVQVLDLQL